MLDNMAKPPQGTYLFAQYGYASKQIKPQLTLQVSDKEFFLQPRDQVVTLVFDVSQRYCTGWHDLATSQSYVCPDRIRLPAQFSQCRHCQVKTGFNPAFYHAQTISPQQQARNQLPHSLYLAHFAPGVIKVGITWAERGIKRLLDQGARSCLIIKTYPNAEIARQYEATIAKLPGIVEMLQGRLKSQLLIRPYDPQAGAIELVQTRDRLVAALTITPEENKPQYLDVYYTGTHQLKPRNVVYLPKQSSISGTCIGMMGNTIICQQQDTQFAMPLSSFIGYNVALGYTQVSNNHQPLQTSLF